MHNTTHYVQYHAKYREFHYSNATTSTVYYATHDTVQSVCILK
jgi:hypothetical protein